jgi:osmoprotectant transport system ATP-binding protein
VELQSEFLKIQQKIKKTIIFVTHDIYEAIKMGDRIALMREGKLVQYDTPTNLLYQPKDEFVEGFVGTDRALKGLQLLRVKDVMTDKFAAANIDEKTEAVRDRMEKDGIDSLPVLDGSSRYAGWVELSDLRTSGDTALKDILSPASVTSDINAVLNEALSLMLSSGQKTLPVITEDNRLAGILTFDNIQEALHEATNTGGTK